MSDDQRVYSDEEFALILRQVTELGSRAEPPGASSAGLTLTEMKEIAAQVGLDPALVQRAARMLVAKVTVSPFERLIGGPLQYSQEVRFPVELDENRTALLLSAVRISAGLAGHRDVGHSGSMGMTWHDGGDTEALRITARHEAAFALYPEAPALGHGGFIAGIGGVLTVARGYWASSTRRARERISAVMDAIARTLSQPETQASGLTTVGDGAAAPKRDASVIGEAEPTSC